MWCCHESRIKAENYHFKHSFFYGFFVADENNELFELQSNNGYLLFYFKLWMNMNFQVVKNKIIGIIEHV